MKYLKPFYESTNEFYHEIDENEEVIQTLMQFYVKYIDIKKKHFEELKKYTELSNTIKYVKDPESDDKQMIIVNLVPKEKYIPQKRVIEFEIYEMMDEWFVVCFYNYHPGKFICSTTNYFKCDQFEGVIKLLKDKKIIK